MKPTIRSVSSRAPERPHSILDCELGNSDCPLCKGEALPELQLRSIIIGERPGGGQTRGSEMVLLCLVLYQQAQDIIDFDSHYRFIVRGGDFAGFQDDLPGNLMLTKLRQLVTAGYIESLLRFWECSTDNRRRAGLSATLRSLEALSRASNCKAIFPLSAPERSFEESSRLLIRCLSRVTSSQSLQRLKACHEGLAQSATLDPFGKEYLDPRRSPLSSDIDRTFLSCCFAMQAMFNHIFCPGLEDVRSIVGRSREQCRVMWQSLAACESL